MKESNKAKVAFEDYFLMGPGRSLQKLLDQYRVQVGTELVPITLRLNTLKTWSNHHGWQNRVLQREAEIASAQLQEIIENAPKTGYAIWQKRVQDLDHVAERLLYLIGLPGLFSPALVREYRGLLGDIAAEMGERIKGIAVSGPDGGPIDINFGATARDTLLGRLLSSASPQDEGRTDKAAIG